MGWAWPWAISNVAGNESFKKRGHSSFLLMFAGFPTGVYG